MAFDLVPLSSDVVTGSGTLNLTGKIFGGFDLNCDGTNEGTVEIRKTDGSGEIIHSSASVVGKSIIAPTKVPSGTVYYSVSGTGADVMLYEWKYTHPGSF